MKCETEIPIDDFCDACQADNLEIISKLDDHQHEICDVDHPNFFIIFKVEFHYPPTLPLEDEGDFLLVHFDLASTTSFHHFWARCERSLDHETLSWGDISAMLTQIRVPLHKQPFMLHRISACADEIAKSSKNKGLRILPIMVSIGIVVDYVSYDIQDATTLVIKENSDVAKLMALPACKGALEALAKEIVQDQEKGSVQKCMICLEKLGFGSEILSMPCSHDYHKDCLLHWLNICNFCPLCRFKLAVS